jgi:hypothetical protein
MDQIRSETIGIVLAKPCGMNIFVKPILNRHQTRGTLKVVVRKSAVRCDYASKRGLQIYKLRNVAVQCSRSQHRSLE